MRLRRRVRVRGRVQGVFFRESARRLAQSLELTGWVRNCPDGSLEAAFEGGAAAVEQAVAFARQGPPAARVESVEVVEEVPAGEADFVVRG